MSHLHIVRLVNNAECVSYDEPVQSSIVCTMHNCNRVCVQMICNFTQFDAIHYSPTNALECRMRLSSECPCAVSEYAVFAIWSDGINTIHTSFASQTQNLCVCRWSAFGMQLLMQIQIIGGTCRIHNMSIVSRDIGRDMLLTGKCFPIILFWMSMWIYLEIASRYFLHVC